MRPPSEIINWLSVEKMFKWLQKAPNESSHKRRMAIWLTHTGKLHANKVADILDVSTQAVWLWIGQYNASGPQGLERKGRGGRRWSYLAYDEESQLLKPFLRAVRAGKQPEPSLLKPLIEAKIGKKVSMPYIYRLLWRHNWSEAIAQSHIEIKQPDIEDDFRKYSQPWLT